MSPPPDGVNAESRWPCGGNGHPHLQSLLPRSDTLLLICNVLHHWPLDYIAIILINNLLRLENGFWYGNLTPWDILMLILQLFGIIGYFVNKGNHFCAEVDNANNIYVLNLKLTLIGIELFVKLFAGGCNEGDTMKYYQKNEVKILVMVSR